MPEFWSGFAVGGFVFFWVGVIAISLCAISKGGNGGEIKKGGLKPRPSTPKPNVHPKSMGA